MERLRPADGQPGAGQGKWGELGTHLRLGSKTLTRCHGVGMNEASQGSVGSRPAWSLVQQEPSADSGTWWQSPSSLAFKWVSCSWLLPWQEARLQGTLSLPGLTAHSPASLHGGAPDHNVTVSPLSSGTLGPWSLLSCSALATQQWWL